MAGPWREEGAAAVGSVEPKAKPTSRMGVAAEWSEGTPGVMGLEPDPKDGEEVVGIRVKITRRAHS